LTSFTAAAGTRQFANLISVAPVTSWNLYDSIDTERHMLRPIDNPDGYTNASVIAAASTNFDSPNWHRFGGTADDNVHFQNSALLVSHDDMRAHHTLRCTSAQITPYADMCLCALPVCFTCRQPEVDALIDLDMPLSVFYFPNRAQSLTHWKTGTPPRYLHQMLIRILTGSNGRGAITNP
jgi:hypothetical protein